MISTPLLFAAAAVVAVWWFNRQTAVSVPAPPQPFSAGIPGLPLPPLPGAAPVGGGMSPLLMAAVLAPWGLLAWTHLVQPAPDHRPDDHPPAPVVDGLDLRGKFVGPTAGEDAAIVAEILARCANALRHDLVADVDHDGKPDGPRLTTGQRVAELRMVARDFRTEGVRIADRQPLALDAIATYLDRTIGDYGGPLDDAKRAQWIAGFEGASQAAKAAIGR